MSTDSRALSRTVWVLAAMGRVLLGCDRSQIQQVNAEVSFSLAQLDFEPTYLGAKRELNVAIENRGRADVDLALTAQSPFSIQESTVHVADGESVAVLVTFRPEILGQAQGALLATGVERFRTPIAGRRHLCLRDGQRRAVRDLDRNWSVVVDENTTRPGWRRRHPASPPGRCDGAGKRRLAVGGNTARGAVAAKPQVARQPANDTSGADRVGRRDGNAAMAAPGDGGHHFAHHSRRVGRRVSKARRR